MDITLHNNEPNTADATYRHFDFPIPWTAAITTDRGTIDFGGGKTALYELGNQTGPTSRWIHIRNLSWDMAAGEKITGTMSTDLGVSFPHFASASEGVDTIGGANSTDKFVGKIVRRSGQDDIDIDLTYWTQTNSSAAMHQWTARGRDLATNILLEAHFTFWPGLDHFDVEVLPIRSDITKNSGYASDIAGIQLESPLAWSAHLWWKSFINYEIIGRPATAVDVLPTGGETFYIWPNWQEQNRFAECSAGGGVLMTVTLSSASAAEVTDVANYTRVGFDCWGMATRADWNGKFGTAPAFWTEFRSPRYSGNFRNPISTIDEVLTRRRSRYTGRLQSGSQSLYAGIDGSTNLVMGPKMHKTGDSPGIGVTKNFVPFCIADGNVQYVSETAFEALVYFRRNIHYRMPGPGDGAFPSNNGEPLEYGTYPDAVVSGGDYFKLDQQQLWPAVYKNYLSNEIPISEASSWNALGSLQKSSFGFGSSIAFGDPFTGGRGSHLYAWEIINLCLLTGKQIFVQFAEQFLRCYLHEWQTGIDVGNPSQKTKATCDSGRDGRTTLTISNLLYATPNTTLTNAVKARLSARATKTPATNHASEFGLLWAKKTASYPFLIHTWRDFDHKTNNGFPSWTAWFMGLSIPGWYAAYLATGDANYLEIVEELGRTWVQDGFYYGVRASVDPNPKWHVVKFIVIPGESSGSNTNPGTAGDRPYRNHPTHGNWYTREDKYVEYIQKPTGTDVYSTWWMAALLVCEKVFTDKGGTPWTQLALQARQIYDQFDQVNGDYGRGVEDNDYIDLRFEDHQINLGGVIRDPQPVIFETEAAEFEMAYGDSAITIIGKPNHSNRVSKGVSFRFRDDRRR